MNHDLALYLFVIFTAITGLLFCITSPSSFQFTPFEPFSTEMDMPTEGGRDLVSDSVSYKCPTVLLQHDSQLMLYRDSYLIARFSSIDDYTAYMQRQYRDLTLAKRTDLQGKQIPITPCPVLYLTPESSAQGQTVYRRNPDPAYQYKPIVNTSEPANATTHDIKPFNAYSVGEGTSEAPPFINGKIGDPRISDSAMDTNWGGAIYSQQMVDSGKYDRRTVGKPITGVNLIGLPSV